MRLLRAISVVITALIVAGSGLAVYLVLDDLTDRLTTAEVRSGENRADAAEANRKAEALAQQVRRLGQTPVVEPNSTTPPQIRYVPAPGKEGAPGARGLPGLPGSDGASVTGKPGESVTGSPGLPGTNGKDGADGKDGKNGVDGAPGKDGNTGTNGTDGRGITSLSCTGLFAPITFTVTYTDGTTAEFSCGTTPDPAPAD